MNAINPVLDSIQTNTKNKISKKINYPIKVYCIVDDLSTASRNTLLRDIKTHTLNSGATFITREYDSRKFSNDRDVIERLPAFHIYINNIYDRTFYSNTRPLDHINESITIHLNNEEKKLKRKEKWKKLYTSFKEWLSKFRYRETAMERYERGQSVNVVNKSEKYTNKNIIPISSWN